ncbi:1-deoxy-D-xylulose-5-phosphate reductoisomerase [Photobacterium profundum]|uniref:1-deoxy-D-xylulose 5-phosphate reductoisomerase n=1 Tax=Photobacterium profundum (strain SS9) TaxID=298386 RepID=DXR_PHOPR|nr:1-deoxy-D-xylulose-5-phosphate reductoisomerase [Photobacterium profundum]Q6LN30.1 RecName: Full=1-deoxy-D-xylulose 5-phosphate reductoisomerase; Short=DXP reductoisomerase; AltName: Full=1-deoxyxylulose-5-phosphate reductoisomerase; AltName: Full=2-C-methyl-D-erythritol 4-phosphate synthase [Photobacterium profundum SS9]CAG21296.1 putative 1-deoxy-D-xylulose 5-phosphatereductoisomerase [Photobacterium profundum SS9]
MRKLTILGATGSIGSSTLAVAAQNPQLFEVVALAAGTNSQKMLELCRIWKPKYAAMASLQAAKELSVLLEKHEISTQVLAGDAGLCQVAALDEIDTVMAAIVGAAGLLPTMAGVKAGKRILLANKEALVMSGQMFIDACEQYGAELLPVDSEHNAIFQCLPADIQRAMGRCDLEEYGISKILLTGSGGPFRYTDIAELASVTPQMAIAHPNWSMGPKISVDSATMMNKGLEYIEARWLFNASREQLQVIIHPQSVIHSMVQYKDGSVLAQMGLPDMQTPIACAMSYPDRVDAGVAPLDFSKIGEFTFLPPDYSRYPCLKLAIDACYDGQAATTALNAANEIAVAAFLNNDIGFTDIAIINEQILNSANMATLVDLESVIELDMQARVLAHNIIRKVA